MPRKDNYNPDLYHHELVLFVLEFHINGIIQDEFSCVYFTQHYVYEINLL